MMPNLGFLPRSTFSAEQVQRLELLKTLVLGSSANSLLTTHWVQAPSPAFQLRPAWPPRTAAHVPSPVLTLHFLPPQFWQGALPGQAGTSHE